MGIDFPHLRPLHEEVIGKRVDHLPRDGFAVQLGKTFDIDDPSPEQTREQASRIRRAGSRGNDRRGPFQDEIDERQEDVPPELEEEAGSFTFLLHQIMMRMLLHRPGRSHILFRHDVIVLALHQRQQLHQFHEMTAAGTDQADFLFTLCHNS